jgi:hypothetical protein
MNPHRASVDVLTNSVIIREFVHAVAETETFQPTPAAIVS